MENRNIVGVRETQRYRSVKCNAIIIIIGWIRREHAWIHCQAYTHTRDIQYKYLGKLTFFLIYVTL